MQLSDRIGRRMKLHDLHVLMAVVQAGSMNKAASLLHTTQPAISRSIGKLEQNLGVRLPHASADAGVSSEVKDVEGGSDVCYDENGEMISDADRCKKIRGH